MSSEEMNRKTNMRQSRDSDRTTHKEIYIKRDHDEYPNLEEINNTIFTPPYKENTVKNQYRRGRSERIKNNEEPSDYGKDDYSNKTNSKNRENDSSSSPEPLSSKLHNDKIDRYDID